MINLLFNRRSIRKYKNQTIEKDLINQILKAALISPSSRSIRPWEFIIIDEKEILDKLSKSKKHGSFFLKDAPLGIIVIADPEKSDVWIEDSSIAAAIIQLTAESFGLSSCWIQIRKRFYDEKTKSEDYIKDILEIPDRFKILSIISLGYKNEILETHTEKELQYEKVKINNYKNKYFLN